MGLLLAFSIGDIFSSKFFTIFWIVLASGIVFDVAYRIIKKRKRFSSSSDSETEVATDADYSDYLVDENVDLYFQEEEKGCKFGKSDLRFSDEQFDNFLIEKVNSICSKELALKKICIDESQVSEVEPIRLHGYLDYGDNIRCKYGKDARFRTSIYNVAWLFFSDKQLYIYSAVINLLISKNQITTKEFFYKDITSFATDSLDSVRTRTRLIKGCFKAKNEVENKNFSLNSLNLVVPNDSFKCAISGIAEVERTIQGLKQKIRDGKFN